MTFKFEYLDCFSKLFSFLIRFIEEQNISIEWPRILGFKQSKIHVSKVAYNLHFTFHCSWSPHVLLTGDRQGLLWWQREQEGLAWKSVYAGQQSPARPEVMTGRGASPAQPLDHTTNTMKPPALSVPSISAAPDPMSSSVLILNVCGSAINFKSHNTLPPASSRSSHVSIWEGETVYYFLITLNPYILRFSLRPTEGPTAWPRWWGTRTSAGSWWSTQWAGSVTPGHGGDHKEEWSIRGVVFRWMLATVF